MAELKPCPFCGSMPELQHGYEIATEMVKVRFACSECGAYAQSAYSTSGAIESWNRRAEDGN